MPKWGIGLGETVDRDPTGSFEWRQSFRNPDGLIDEEGGKVSSSMPLTRVHRFMMPNTSSLLNPYTNDEQDHIKQTFQSSNYTSLADLPNKVGTGAVLSSKYKKQAVSVTERTREADEVLRGMRPSVPSATNSRGMFSEFDFMPVGDSDVVRRNLAFRELTESKRKQKTVSENDFRPTGSILITKGDLMPKYHSDPYELAEDLDKRSKWLENSKIVAGHWKPINENDRLTGEKPTPAALDDIIHEFVRLLRSDWADSDFTISIRDEHIVVAFLLETVDSDEGLLAYMNILCRCNEMLNKHKLKKVVEQWNVRPGDGRVYFVFRPPWIVRAPTDTYYHLYPSERKTMARKWNHSGGQGMLMDECLDSRVLEGEQNDANPAV